MNEKIFSDLGLTKNETKVYLTLLKTGSSLAGEITESSGVHRRNVYDVVERLIEKGLVSYVVTDNKKWFTPVNPKRFLDLIEEKKQALDDEKKEFAKMIPQLTSMAKMQKKQEVKFFKGVEGLKTVYEDILAAGKNYYGFGPGDEVEDVLKHYFKHFIEKRRHKSIHKKMIYPLSAKGKYYTKTPLTDVRYIPDKYISHAALRIYDDKAVIILFSEMPLAIQIKNKEIADGYKKYFEMMWNAAQK